MRSRGFRAWKVLWGWGGTLPVSKVVNGKRKVEVCLDRIVGFRWAMGMGKRTGVLGLCTEEGEVVLLGVGRGDGRWRVQEVARFSTRGPHGELDVGDMSE